MTDTPLDPHPAAFHDLLGIELVDWQDGLARVACMTGPQHMNRSGIVHGGVMLSLIDQAAAYAGLWCSVPGNIRRDLCGLQRRALRIERPPCGLRRRIGGGQ